MNKKMYAPRDNRLSQADLDKKGKWFLIPLTGITFSVVMLLVPPTRFEHATMD